MRKLGNYPHKFCHCLSLVHDFELTSHFFFKDYFFQILVAFSEKLDFKFKNQYLALKQSWEIIGKGELIFCSFELLNHEHAIEKITKGKS